MHFSLLMSNTLLHNKENSLSAFGARCAWQEFLHAEYSFQQSFFK